MPISQETKDQIDDLATDIAALETGKERRQEINAALTNYAEKLEEKDKEIEGLKEAVQNLHDGYDICKNDYQKVITKYKSELAQLKEIGSKLFNSLRDLDFMLSVFDPRVSQNDIKNKVFTLMDMAEKLNGANKT